MQAKCRFINKYRKRKMLDNLFMNNKETRGRKKQITDEEKQKIIDQLTEDELKDIAKRYMEIIEEKEKKKEASQMDWPASRKALFFRMHRSTFYKHSKSKKYKFDFIKKDLIQIFNNNKGIYGSKRLAIELSKKGISISDRTLRHYMSRWGLQCITRRKKRKSEIKNTNVKYVDLVKRNFNPVKDNIVATDVSYIPAKTKQNFIYLSVAISHKTKLIESWKISLSNNVELVKETLLNITTRKDLIIHSDHGFQYSHEEILKIHNKNKSNISMGRIGNSLDNREVEYFFSNLKSECLNHIPTYKMTLNEIIPIVNDYINWYNTKRIQKRLQWKTPASASAYAI